jgi:hypothetical protein
MAQLLAWNRAAGALRFNARQHGSRHGSLTLPNRPRNRSPSTSGSRPCVGWAVTVFAGRLDLVNVIDSRPRRWLRRRAENGGVRGWDIRAVCFFALWLGRSIVRDCRDLRRGRSATSVTKTRPYADEPTMMIAATIMI